MPLDDVVLLERVAAGDRDVFMDLYDAYAPRVLGLLVRLIGNRSEAEDVLQDVMVAIWERASSYDPRLGSPSTWILMLARSRAIDRLRRLGRQGERLAELRAGGTRDAVDPVSAADEGLGRALEQLPAEQRLPIMLAFYHGLTREQIAEHQQVPVGTVKTRIRAGLHRLRDLLAAAEAPAR